MSEATRTARRVTSVCRCLTTDELSESEMAATVGVATSTILSAMSASLARSVAAAADASLTVPSVHLPVAFGGIVLSGSENNR